MRETPTYRRFTLRATRAPITINMDAIACVIPGVPDGQCMILLDCGITYEVAESYDHVVGFLNVGEL